MCELRNRTWKEQEVEGGGGEMKERRDTWAWPTDKQEWPGFNVKLFVLLQCTLHLAHRTSSSAGECGRLCVCESSGGGPISGLRPLEWECS